MSRRMWIMGSAVLLAAVILAVTFYLGAGTGAKRPKEKLSPKELAGLNPHKGDVRSIGNQELSQYTLQFYNSKNQLVWFEGAHLKPLGDGASLAVAPRIRLVLSPRRLMEVRADEGTFEAPNNKPRKGVFRKNVVFTIYEQPVKGEVDLSDDSPDALLRAYMSDDADFDMDTGTLDSRGRVHLTSSQIDFLGTGLSISYSDLLQRINRMEIAKGERVLVRESGGAGGAAGGDGTPATQPAGNAVQWYRASFDRDVKVHDSDTDIAADVMALVFSLESDRSKTPIAAEKIAGPAHREPERKGKRGLSKAFKPPDAGPQDTTVTWAGKLVMLPEAATPDLSGSGDVAVSLTGTPVKIVQRKEQSTTTAAQVDYQTGRQRLILTGDKLYPLSIDSADAGVLRGERLTIDQRSGTGLIEGAGSMAVRERPHAGVGGADGGKVAEPAGQARELRIKWSDHVDLRFFTADAAGHAGAAGQGVGPFSRQGGAIRGIRSAGFVGQVKADHPDMVMKSDKLSVEFDRAAAGDSEIKTIVATGHVDAAKVATFDDPAMSIKSDQLQVDVARAGANGPLEPVRLVATGNVRGDQRGQQIQAGLLDIAFSRPVGHDGKPQQRQTIASINAKDQVHILRESDGLDVKADRLTQDAATRLVHLFADEGHKVIVARPDSTLTGQNVVLNQEKQTVEVPGEGVLEFIERHRAADAGAAPSPVADRKVAVTWKKSMTYNSKTGEAHFVDGVKSRSDTATDRHELTTSDLTVYFSSSEGGDAARLDVLPFTGGPAIARAAPNPRKPDDPSRSITHMIAKERVAFCATTWLEKPDGKAASRLRLEGPLLTFENVKSSREVRVVGPGSMLVEDYRPEPAPAAGQGEGSTAAPVVRLSGRGATLFTWKKQMILNRLTDVAQMDENVEMLHRPIGDAAVAQLNCAKLTADLGPVSGGAKNNDAWLSGQAPALKVKAVNADQAVRIIWGDRTVYADHLKYVGADQMVQLWADPGRLTEVIDQGRFTSYSAERLKWHLDKNRIEVEKPGPNRMLTGSRP